MDILLKYGIITTPSENCLREIKFIKDPDVDQFLCIGVLLNFKSVYLLNIDSSKLNDEKVQNILTTFNSNKSLLTFNTIIKITDNSVIFCYDYVNMSLINYMYFINQHNNLQIKLCIYKQMIELINYFQQKNIMLDVYNPKLFFIVDDNGGPSLKVLYHSK
jgi:hypothetical protein